MTNQSGKPSYILTPQGKRKLEAAVQRKYGRMTRFKTDLAVSAGIDRNTLSKIWDAQTGADYSSIDKVFSALNLDLMEEDYQIFEKPRSSSTQNSSEDKPKQQTSPRTKLQEALRELNYIEQEYRFRTSLLRIKQTGAFLIHGKPGYGQRLLLNRLVSQVPFNANAYQKRLDINRPKDINTLWENLGQTLSCQSRPQDLVHQVYQHWETQTVILALDNIDRITGDGLKQFIEQFWKQLVNQVFNAETRNSDFKILLFLIDNKGCNGELGISLALTPDPVHPHIPIDLTSIQEIEESEIRRWVGAKFLNLLNEFFGDRSHNLDWIVQDILGRNTHPVFAINAICEYCDLSYYTDIEKDFKP